MSRTLDQIFELMDSLHYYEAQLERFTTSRQVLADLLSNIINYQTTMIIIENGVITQVFPNGSAPGNVFCAGSTTATSSVLGSVTIGHPGGIQITVGEGRITITGQGSQNFNGVEISSLQSEARYRMLCRELDDKIAQITLTVCSLQQTVDREFTRYRAQEQAARASQE